MKRIYIGNLSADTTENHIEKLFARYGDVAKAGLVRDHDTGKPRGFGFVLMRNDLEGDDAIRNLNYMRLNGSVILVRDAVPANWEEARKLSPRVRLR